MLCALTATIISMPSLRPKYPFSLTLTSYQVGNPCILEGKIFFGVTGTPILKMALQKSKLALADPVPFTLANLTTKSFIFNFSDII